MNRWLLELLCCPSCKAELEWEPFDRLEGELLAGDLACKACRERYPLRNGVPCFVASALHHDPFGLQWNQFRRTQLDSFTGVPISRQRFFLETGWQPAELKGKLVLDVGCGAGRFAETVLATGARLVAVDSSSATDACLENLGGHDLLGVAQANLYRLPFRPKSFDFVYCFGVLQHTPDVKAAFMAIVEQLKPGGRIAVDVYPRSWSNAANPKYWLRVLTKRMSSAHLLSAVRTWVPVLLPLSTMVGRIPSAGRKLRRLIPVANYEGIYALSPKQLCDWALLDTFDMLAPVHDHPISVSALRSWFAEADLGAVEVFKAGVLVGRAVKPG
jgi:SAM-dependent methyltransferase